MKKIRLKLNNFFGANKKGRESNLSLKGGGGFTLIEIVVATGIFGLVVIMIGSIFMVSFFGHRRILALQNLQDNLRFSIEAMAREIRVGTSFSAISQSSISFTSGTGKAIVYRLNNNAIERSDDGGANFLPMTDSSIKVTILNFNPVGILAGDDLQPRINFTVHAEAQVGTQKSVMDIQTTLSQRFLQS